MARVTAESWRTLPARSDLYAEFAAEALPGGDRIFLAVDHEGARHLLLAADDAHAQVSDQRSRGIRAFSRELTIQGQTEAPFIDVVCAVGADQDVFNLVADAIVEQVAQGGDRSQSVRSTLERWRRFWGSAPVGGLDAHEVRGLFGELWFLSNWLLAHGQEQIVHWLGPSGARHDFQWPGVAIEAKATMSTHGHVHRINGLDQLDPPADGQLMVFSLRAREEVSASDSVVTLIEAISSKLEGNAGAQDGFELRLSQAGYSPVEADRYAEFRFRVISDRLYEVGDGFPRLSSSLFIAGVPDGIDRIEYEVDLDACPDLIVAGAAGDFEPPAS